MTTIAQKKAAKRARRPIYVTCMRLIDPKTGEEFGCFVPSNPIDQRLAKERGFRVGHEYRAEIKQPRNPAFHRLVHAIGNLLVDNVDEFQGLDGHAAVKRVQLQAGVACEIVEMDASPVIAALLDAAEAVLGQGARKVLAAVLPAIKTIPVKVAQSLAFDSMSEDEFDNFFDGITEHIGKQYAHVLIDEIRAEFWEMAGNNRRAA